MQTAGLLMNFDIDFKCLCMLYLIKIFRRSFRRVLIFDFHREECQVRKTLFSRLVALILSAALLSLSVLAVSAGSTSNDVKGGGEESDYVAETLEILGDIKWPAYIEKYGSVPFYTGKPVVIDAASYSDVVAPSDADSSASGLDFKVLDELGGESKVLQTPDVGSVTWTVTVPEEGLYAIDIDYYPIVSKGTNIERTLRINGEVPFNQVRNLVFSRLWTDDYSYGDDGKVVFETDGNGNEKRPSKVEINKWMTETVSDPTGYYNGEFYFYFAAGENTITLESQKEPMAIKTITLRAHETEMTYAEYLADCKAKGYTAAPADASIYIEAEHYIRTSDSTLYAINDTSSAITSPQHACYQRLNAIGSTKWGTIGQWFKWEFEVPEGKAGMYTINPRYLQNAVSGMFVSRKLMLDDEIPFEEANNLEFYYNTKWQTTPFSDGTDEFEFYLSEGKHSFSLEVTLGNFAEVYAEVQDCLNDINEIYLKILQITGTSPDSYMDYEFWSRIPNEIKEMKVLADRLTAVSDLFIEISGGASSNSATLLNVAQILYKMNKDSEGQIAKNFTALKSNIGSLGTWLNNMMKQSLTIDYFVIQPAGGNLPKSNGNFFQEAWFEIQAFVYSFIYDGYSFASETDDGEIVQVEVWTTVSREYAQIIRELIDEDFSNAYPNISVNLKLVAAGTLLPATLAGVGPDVMMGATQTEVIDYAVRGAVLDVSGYDGFDELKSRFSDAAMVPLTVALGSPDGDIAVYGIPQTQSFNVMFYRKDILAQLGITIPETWTEFKAILPKLLSKNYMIGMGKSAAISPTFYMFMYQNGGSLFTDNGTTISFNSDASLTAFDQLCKFYTQYSFPVTYDEANRFRTGEMPVLIADYITFYNQFTIFATELKGLWGFTLVPGVEQADGSVNRSTYSSVTAMVLMKDAASRGTDEAGFKFMEWWMRTDIQGQYANELIALLGPAGKYNSANVEAFNSMSWTSSELKALNTITQNLFCTNEMPGSYIISRYVTFAFTDVYNENANPAEEILQYVSTINSEMDRKREELNRQFYVPSEKAKDD